MNAYVWQNVSGLTDYWHDGGGVLVVTETLARARDMIGEKQPKPGEGEAFTTEPDYVYALQPGVEETVIIFPDAGCC